MANKIKQAFALCVLMCCDFDYVCVCVCARLCVRESGFCLCMMHLKKITCTAEVTERFLSGLFERIMLAADSRALIRDLL